MNYEHMSDFEINKMVALAIDTDGDIECVTQRKSKLKCISNQAMVKIKGMDGVEAFNPCNNPSDAWQIIIDNRLTVTPYGDPNHGWFATYDTSFFVDNKNPLRAAMICFLKMKDAEK